MAQGTSTQQILPGSAPSTAEPTTFYSSGATVGVTYNAYFVAFSSLFLVMFVEVFFSWLGHLRSLAFLCIC